MPSASSVSGPSWWMPWAAWRRSRSPSPPRTMPCWPSPSLPMPLKPFHFRARRHDRQVPVVAITDSPFSPLGSDRRTVDRGRRGQFRGLPLHGRHADAGDDAHRRDCRTAPAGSLNSAANLPDEALETDGIPREQPRRHDRHSGSLRRARHRPHGRPGGDRRRLPRACQEVPSGHRRHHRHRLARSALPRSSRPMRCWAAPKAAAAMMPNCWKPRSASSMSIWRASSARSPAPRVSRRRPRRPISAASGRNAASAKPTKWNPALSLREMGPFLVVSGPAHGGGGRPRQPVPQPGSASSRGGAAAAASSRRATEATAPRARSRARAATAPAAGRPAGTDAAVRHLADG